MKSVMPLPIALSVPHGGTVVPEIAADLCILSPRELREDGDEGAAEIYDLRNEVAAFIAAEVPRAIVDLNRAENDRSPDGVVKTCTIFEAPVYSAPLSAELIEEVIQTYHRPYHARLSELARSNVILAVDCHTMLAVGPPIGPDPGGKRPEVCLGDANGKTLPPGWMDQLARCFRNSFAGFSVTVNEPFSGGHITRTHGREMPWLQLELSRGPFLSNAEKRARVLAALTQFCAAVRIE